ncbi:MAG: ABC transporter ATP-binding protein [Deltaproteobacteria bacterium]|nr:ABC transporter ATP-binding protein [Deltaproteobacteria bacterium]MBW1950616.1 ABC transporter ATP-binding protein [Deltaproteobacteria bacterium]MBW2008867.1 ABC transporter ATP-binding protein [Deltaproteobacteria bacterium]MBW2349228.1 ABC transporter ATP-binding protein [Deltaproteobacteria bacterium]
MLRLEGVHAYYGRIHALKGVSLEVREGHICCLIGANGAGKSTTLMTISGITPIASGTVTYQGQPIHRVSPEEIVRRGIVQVPEGRRIFPNLTVQENLMLGAYLQRDKAEKLSALERSFSMFPILRERRRQPGGTLSGGEQQMLAIARALMGTPRLLLLDEPSLGLAPLIVERIMGIIRQIRDERGATILLVEQNAQAALDLSDYGYVIETGEVVQEDSARRLLEDPRVREAYLG